MVQFIFQTIDFDISVSLQVDRLTPARSKRAHFEATTKLIGRKGYFYCVVLVQQVRRTKLF